MTKTVKEKLQKVVDEKKAILLTTILDNPNRKFTVTIGNEYIQRNIDAISAFYGVFDGTITYLAPERKPRVLSQETLDKRYQAALEKLNTKYGK